MKMNDFTYFPKKERISWILFALLVLIAFFLPSYLFPEKKTVAHIRFSKESIDSTLAAAAKENKPSIARSTRSDARMQKIPAADKKAQSGRKINPGKNLIFPFDPNLTPDDSILLLFPRFVAQNLIKYRNNGGAFREKKALLKIYGMDSTLFRKIEPFIRIHSAGKKNLPSSNDHFHRKQDHQKKHKPIALNDADTSMLKSIPGIGRVFARRIISFRNALGGFISVDQVAETYGLPAETFQKIRGQLIIGRPQRRIRVNSAAREELAAHPYINWKQARAICLFRDEHGTFADPGDMLAVRALDSAFIVKIGPYLDFRLFPETRGDSIRDD